MITLVLTSGFNLNIRSAGSSFANFHDLTIFIKFSVVPLGSISHMCTRIEVEEERNAVMEGMTQILERSRDIAR